MATSIYACNDIRDHLYRFLEMGHIFTMETISNTFCRGTTFDSGSSSGRMLAECCRFICNTLGMFCLHTDASVSAKSPFGSVDWIQVVGRFHGLHYL